MVISNQHDYIYRDSRNGAFPAMKARRSIRNAYEKIFARFNFSKAGLQNGTIELHGTLQGIKHKKMKELH